MQCPCVLGIGLHVLNKCQAFEVFFPKKHKPMYQAAVQQIKDIRSADDNTVSEVIQETDDEELDDEGRVWFVGARSC